MEGNGRPYFKKRFNPQFKRKGGSKKGKWQNSGREQSSENFQASDTVYRILCLSKKIGSVIGKGGSIIKSLREETQAKITVADSVPGSDERVIIIHSPSTKAPKRHNTENSNEDLMDENEDDLMEMHCAAQDALLKVHDRIIEEDLFGETENGDDNETVVTARLLVPNNMVGCVLGKKGDVIQRLRSDTGASIRVLPAEHLPTCAMSTDELVQISGKPAIAKRALYDVSTLLHQNPRKDKPPSSFPMPYGGQGYHHPGPSLPDMLPPGNPVWSQRNKNPRGVPPMPWMGGYENQPSGFGPRGFNSGPAPHGGEAPSEVSIKILCSAAKIGGVIGKGGANVKQLQLETGASIHVDDVSADSDERVIRVSSVEAIWNPRSQTIEAILQLQNKTSEFSEKGVITTRLLVPSSKVGCLLGQGGQVINEMRRRTQADIRVFSKEEKPKCASEDEELVQISGSFGVAKDALAEIASRLRMRWLRDANAGVDPAPRFGPIGNLPGAGPPPSGAIGAGTAGVYEPLKGGGRDYEPPTYGGPDYEPPTYGGRDYEPPSYGGHDYGPPSYGGRDYEPPSYPVPQSTAGYQNINRSMEMKIPNHAAGSSFGTGGSNIAEIAGTRMKLQDPPSGGSERVAEIRGSSDHLNTVQSIYQGFITTGGQTNNPPQSSYQNYSTQQNAYPTINASQTPYQNFNPQQAPYQTLGTQQAPYQNVRAQGSYQY